MVQLCSYLIKRQHRAIDLYLGAQDLFYAAATAASQYQDLSGDIDRTASSSLHQRSNVPAVLDTATSKAMKDLKMEVQERLGRLQERLCI